VKRQILIASAVVLVLLATFLVGYWPQRQKAAALELEAQGLRDRVAELEARTRGAELLGALLHLTDAASRKDYGQAQTLSTVFFDQVRAQASGSALPALRSGLPEVLAERDAVTGALANPDGQVVSRLHQLQLKLRAALGYPTS
jgi:hypothetical protein